MCRKRDKAQEGDNSFIGTFPQCARPIRSAKECARRVTNMATIERATVDRAMVNAEKLSLACFVLLILILFLAATPAGAQQPTVLATPTVQGCCGVSLDTNLNQIYVGVNSDPSPQTVVYNVNIPGSPVMLTTIDGNTAGDSVDPTTHRFWGANVYSGDVLIYTGSASGPTFDTSVDVSGCP